MKYVKLYILLCLKVFLFVKAQVTFDPDPDEDVQLKRAVLTPPVNVTTVQCYSSSPKFKLQYVNQQDNNVVYDIDIYDGGNSTGMPINNTSCGQAGQSKFSVLLANLRFIADPKFVGSTFKLKVILDNNEENSTLSRRTYTFTAPFNLTGSSVAAVRYLKFTWTCHVTSDNPVIEWFQGRTNLGQIGIFANDTCFNSVQNESYKYSCQRSTSTYSLTIPGSILTEELQASTWRCKDIRSEVNGSKFMELDVVYPPTVTLYVQNSTENTVNIMIRCTATGKPNNVTIVAHEQRIGSTLIRNITTFTKSSHGNMTLTLYNVSYQDMGTYTCLASNGIPDINNKKIQSDTAYFNVNTSAKFEMMQYIVRSNIDTPVVVRIPFYSNPPASENDVVWTRNTGAIDETLEASTNFSFSLSDNDVQQTFHGVDVTLKGQSAIMNIPSFQSYYEGHYTLKIRSSPTESEELKIVILHSEYNSRETLAGPPKRNDDNADGLKDNPLYGGSPSGANTVQGASSAPGNPSVYAEVVKPKKKNPAKVNDDPPPIYAEVNRSSKKNAKGEQYQNMDGFKQTGSTDKKKAKENEQRGYKNKDGLFYMDVKFDQHPTRGKPTIRKEEPTGYAMIQFEESNAKSTSSNARGAEGGQ